MTFDKYISRYFGGETLFILSTLLPMNSKADLKIAREAIGAKKFNDAVKACKRVLLWEGENYNA